MPKPTDLVKPTTPHNPLVLRGIKIDPQDPFKLNFLIDEGDTSLDEAEIKQEVQKHINYFLASLTIPEEDLWVNLSPYEQDRIIPNELSLTGMGKDMLSQDYTLKQLMSSLTYPESELGKQFWQKVYKQVQEKLGTTNIPIDTFNKVWIVPEKAVVYEDGELAFIGETKLKVLLEEDYLALTNSNRKNKNPEATNQISSQVMCEVILPIIEQEVNQGEYFVSLRKIYHALILASWYKDRLSEGFISRAYANQRKIKGIDLVKPETKQDIYDQYVQAYKKGVYNYIRKDYDSYNGQYISRRYYSGGTHLGDTWQTVVTLSLDPAMVSGYPALSVALEPIFVEGRVPERWDDMKGGMADNGSSSSSISANEFEKGLIDIFELDDGHVHQGSVRYKGRQYPYTLFENDFTRYDPRLGPVYFRAGDIFVLNAAIEPHTKKYSDQERGRKHDEQKKLELQHLLKRFPNVIRLYEPIGEWRAYRTSAVVSSRIYYLPATIGVLIAMQADRKAIQGHTFIDAFSRNGLMANAAFLLGASDVVINENDPQSISTLFLRNLGIIAKSVKLPETSDLIRVNLAINGNLDNSRVYYRTIRQVPETEFKDAVLAYNARNFGFKYMEASKADIEKAKRSVPPATRKWDVWLDATSQGEKIRATERPSLLRDIRNRFKGVSWIIVSGGAEVNQLKSHGVTQKIIDEAESLSLNLHSRLEIRQPDISVDDYNLTTKKQTLIMPTLTFKDVRRRTIHRQGKAAVSSPSNTGGIDLNADYLVLNTSQKKLTQSFSNLPYHLDDIEGFIFTVSSIKKYSPSK